GFHKLTRRGIWVRPQGAVSHSWRSMTAWDRRSMTALTRRSMTAENVSINTPGGHRPPLQSELSEARRLYPEARIPAPARRNRLEFLVKTLVSKVHGVGDTRHGFESDEVRIALAAARDGRIRRPDHDGTPVGTEHDLELLMFSFKD